MTRMLLLKVTKVLILLFLLGCLNAAGQPSSPSTGAVALYRDLLNPSFDVKDVYHVRDVSILREDLHISISDGTIALMREVNGHVTGAVFEGVGEVLLVPPNRAERTSLGLFTGFAVLELRFQSAYFRLADDELVRELRSGFRTPAEDAEEFIARWKEPATLMSRSDALPILESMTSAKMAGSRFLHVRIGGTPSGIVDLFYDTNAPEQISVAQAGIINGVTYYDIWTSFPMRSVRESAGDEDPASRPNYEVADYQVHAKVQPPTDLSAEAEFLLTPKHSGQRTVVLEFSRFLKLTEARVDGKPVEFIQNEAISGSDLARRGDDLIGVVLPVPLVENRPVKMSFKYSGPVMFNAGGELIYVGSRGTWYPNLGPSFTTYDLTFECPVEWSVVATGKQVFSEVNNGLRTTRFITDKPIGRAGFNLGKFATASASSGKVEIHAYGARNVEQSLAGAEARVGRKPDPAREAQQIAEQAAATVGFLANELDPFPYSNLEITQLPGLLSQSWPGLIYLSSTAFLSPDERRALVHDPYLELLLSRLMLSHETAHQWWGDAVDWVSYRDEWIIEALANYSALIMLEKLNPGDMKTALNYYRGELLKETRSGIIADAGPVTLGHRLTSSKFPDAYQRVLYGRGTWLIHMLRSMMYEAGGEKSDALFFSALKGLLATAPNHKVSTLDLQRAFEKVMPASLGYEGKKSLEWFFDSWVNGDSIPQFALQGVRMVATANGRTRITGTIVQTQSARDMVTAVPLYTVDVSGKTHFLAFVFADDPKTEFTLMAPPGTREILLDPEETVLRR